jgi:probable rRNA maturation factor
MSINITVIINDKRWSQLPFDLNILAEQVISLAAKSASFNLMTKNQIDCNLLCTDDPEIRQLNKEFRDIDKATNVLSFPSEELKPGSWQLPYNDLDFLHLGDIAISYDTIMQEIEEEKQDKQYYVSLMIIHGFLHLLGYDHQNEEEAVVMEGLEQEILQKINF